MPELHEAHAAFQQPPRNERLPPVDVLAVKRAETLGFPAQVKRVARLHLHAEGEFKGLDAGVEPRIVRAGGFVLVIQLAEQTQLALLHLGGRVRAADVLDEFLQLRVLGVDKGPLIHAGQEAVLPVLRVLDGVASGAHRDEAGQVLVLRAEAVKHPRAEAGPRLHGVAAVHQHERRLVVGHLRIHRAHHRDVVGELCGAGKDLADFEAALAAALELEGRGKCRARLAFGEEVLAGQLLAGVFGERGLWIECVHVRRPAIEEEVNDALGSCAVVRGFWCKGVDRLRGVR